LTQMADTKEIISTAIEFEHFGREYYVRFQELVADSKAKALMKSLGEDEKEHAEILTRQLRELGGEAKKPSAVMLAKGMAEIFPERMKKNSIATKDAVSAIKLGMRTEQRSIDFYSKHARGAPHDLKEIFERLEKMERGHLSMLEDNLRNLEDEGVWTGYVPILEG
jgi:rubrerythrin